MKAEGQTAQQRDAEQQYEYKFIRLGEGWLGTKNEAERDYQGVVHKHARQGWRLVQIFAPGTGASGAAKFYEIILEKKL